MPAATVPHLTFQTQLEYSYHIFSDVEYKLIISVWLVLRRELGSRSDRVSSRELCHIAAGWQDEGESNPALEDLK